MNGKDFSLGLRPLKRAPQDSLLVRTEAATAARNRRLTGKRDAHLAAAATRSFSRRLSGLGVMPMETPRTVPKRCGSCPTDVAGSDQSIQRQLGHQSVFVLCEGYSIHYMRIRCLYLGAFSLTLICLLGGFLRLSQIPNVSGRFVAGEGFLEVVKGIQLPDFSEKLPWLTAAACARTCVTPPGLH